MHSDLHTHVLRDIAVGASLPPALGEVDAAEHLRLLEDDLKATRDHAGTNGRRLLADFLRTLMSSDWTGMAARMDGLLTSEECVVPIWIHTSAFFGRASAATAFFERQWTCNRVDYDVASTLLTVRAATAGSSDTILDNARRMREAVGPHRWFDEYEVIGLALGGQLDSAKALLDASTAMPAADKRRFGLMFAVLANDQERMNALRAAVAADPRHDLSRRLIVAAWFGEKESAGEIARRIDAAPLGHMGLLWATEYCFCGSPFPLEAAPNFSERLKEGNLPWPPKAPLKFPAKDW